jgi:hypothetical protein
MLCQSCPDKRCAVGRCIQISARGVLGNSSLVKVGLWDVDDTIEFRLPKRYRLAHSYSNGGNGVTECWSIGF